MKSWIIKRGAEPSTWAGISALLALAGLNVEQVQAISHAGAALAGVLAVFMGERRD